MNRTDLRRLAGIAENAQTAVVSIEANLQTATEMLNQFKNQPSPRALDMIRRSLTMALQATAKLTAQN